jgi:hypothetical protein
MNRASESKPENTDLPESKQDVKREKIYFWTEIYLNYILITNLKHKLLLLLLLLLIQYYIPLHVSSHKCSSSGGYIVYVQHMVVTLYERSWWPVGIQTE